MELAKESFLKDEVPVGAVVVKENNIILNGSKTFITNGHNANLVLVIAKTDLTKKAKGISIVLCEDHRKGFKKGRNLIKIELKVLGYINYKKQIDYQKKLEISAQKKEDSILDLAKESWNSKFLNIYKSRGLYAIKLSSSDSLNFYGDSIENEIIIGYTMSEVSGRLIYETSYINPEVYDKSKEGQLLEGFEILVENFQKGDSIVALIPSYLLFGRNGSFVNQIPPFTPMKINLKIN